MACPYCRKAVIKIHTSLTTTCNSSFYETTWNEASPTSDGRTANNRFRCIRMNEAPNCKLLATSTFCSLCWPHNAMYTAESVLQSINVTTNSWPDLWMQTQ